MRTLVCLVLLLGASCSPTPPPAAVAPAPIEAPAPARFGAALGAGPVVPLGLVVAHPDPYLGATVKVAASVGAVCKKKGCWFTLTTAGTPVRVTMKDYGFFIPTNAEGKSAVVQGVLQRRELSPDAVAHLKEDGAGEVASNELHLVASGVELR